MLVRQLFYLLRLTRTAQKDEGKINGRLAQLDPFLPWKEDHIFLSRKEARSSIIFGFVSISSSLLQKERRIPPFFAESSGHHLLLRGFTAAEGEVGHFEFQKRGGGETAGHQVAIEERDKLNAGDPHKLFWIGREWPAQAQGATRANKSLLLLLYLQSLTEFPPRDRSAPDPSLDLGVSLSSDTFALLLLRLLSWDFSDVQRRRLCTESHRINSPQNK